MEKYFVVKVEHRLTIGNRSYNTSSNIEGYYDEKYYDELQKLLNNLYDKMSREKDKN